MGTFLKSAFTVLDRAQEPLTAKELTDQAINGGHLVTSGKTPHQTMKSKISTDILNKKTKSQFKRASAGKFALRSWEFVPEYAAPRHKKALFDEDILVINQTDLLNFVSGNGLVTDTECTNEPIAQLRQISFTKRRRDAEIDTSLVQLISVFIVRFGDLYLTHKRTKRLPESRLHGFYSLILGGHLTPDDIEPLFNRLDTHRELLEELKLGYIPEIKYKGLLYDDSRDVSKIHLGIVFDVNLKNEKYEIGEKGFLMDSKFETIEEIRDRIDDFENWSQLIINGGEED